MAVETAADLAGFFLFGEYAEAAVYLAPGAPIEDSTPCLVIVDRGQGRAVFDAGERQAEGPQLHIWAQFAELPAVVRRGTFRMLDEPDGIETGEIFEIAGLPRLDHEGAIWSCELIDRSV
ncbi:head-tail joining protein [Croceicoccus naphthovorans]|uniref:Uncharacterized protein n=1 Tax=Croceicoccus naphthovorans TaxID=1348774 RepID=A0A0G3XHJ3_9SPHN|nr:hypothetical protein [Croceicoccus naphthovorans]AKM09873.1 hypothetical protein AB433_07565 [Croceicoccus naphthovorans]MBB3991332.1 hypothetical protein [Croceicoccus naphthovorans]